MLKNREAWHPYEGGGAKLLLLLTVTALVLVGCDSEREKAWKKWREEAGKVDYRCGMFGEYEFKINRAYLFSWPTYEGRSDWKVQGPPPLSCSAKLETMPMEAYWPGLSPAGYHTAENMENPDRIYININSVPNVKNWDLVLRIEASFGKEGWKKTSSYEKNKENLGLDYARGPHWLVENRMSDYYWVEDSDGKISTVIECYANHPTEEASCTQDQYIPEMQAVLIIKYQKSKIVHWKKITLDARDFIKNRTEPKRS